MIPHSSHPEKDEWPKVSRAAFSTCLPPSSGREESLLLTWESIALLHCCIAVYFSHRDLIPVAHILECVRLTVAFALLLGNSEVCHCQNFKF